MLIYVDKNAKMRAVRFVEMRRSTCLFGSAYFCTILSMCNPLL